MSHGASGWLELLSVDGGPGMTDVQRCLQDGYSTAGTPGNGLGAVKRLSDEFDVHSTPGKGTVIVSRIATSTAPSNAFAVGAVCLPFPGEEVCGDTWRSVEREREIAVMVADGLGHGPEAAVAARPRRCRLRGRAVRVARAVLPARAPVAERQPWRGPGARGDRVVR